jgi:hypothetical protein
MRMQDLSFSKTRVLPGNALPLWFAIATMLFAACLDAGGQQLPLPQGPAEIYGNSLSKERRLHLSAKLRWQLCRRLF